VQGALVSVAVLPRSDGMLGTGVVTGRRLGGAVERNRARRVIKAAVRSIADRAPGGADVAILAEAAIAGARMQDVAEELESLLTRAGVIAE
jgi:ribonuclease P protein component